MLCLKAKSFCHAQVSTLGSESTLCWDGLIMRMVSPAACTAAVGKAACSPLALSSYVRGALGGTSKGMPPSPSLTHCCGFQRRLQLSL